VGEWGSGRVGEWGSGGVGEWGNKNVIFLNKNITTPKEPVLPGNTIAIAGGNIIIEGGILQATDGQIELGGLAGEGTIGIAFCLIVEGHKEPLAESQAWCVRMR